MRQSGGILRRRPRRTLAMIMSCLLLAASAQAQGRTDPLDDIPLTEVPAATGQTLAIFWSGDGGWAALASTVSKQLAANGIAVVGVNSRTWLEHGKRGPDDVAHDSERLLRAYLTKWSRSRIVLIGYSRGADFLPFIVTRLPADLRERVDLVAMLGAAPAASFEFHLLDLVRDSARPTDMPLMPELLRSTGTRYLCMYGTAETSTLCPQLDASKYRIVARTGDHHFDRNYPEIAQDILRALPAR